MVIENSTLNLFISQSTIMVPEKCIIEWACHPVGLVGNYNPVIPSFWSAIAAPMAEWELDLGPFHQQVFQRISDLIGISFYLLLSSSQWSDCYKILHNSIAVMPHVQNFIAIWWLWISQEMSKIHVSILDRSFQIVSCLLSLWRKEPWQQQSWYKHSLFWISEATQG